MQAQRSLIDFIRFSWSTVEPGRDLKMGWAIGAMCEHLEAVSNGEITRLLMNVPPGAMKSLTTGVFWPAWEWTRDPTLRFLGTAHKGELALRDSRRCRQIIQSRWYQNLWGDDFFIVSDQNAKKKFENNRGGFREAMPFSSLTGSRGDRVVVDDPMSVDDATSKVKRDRINETFSEAVPTRLNDSETSAIVVIMQRLHEDDTSGVILSRDLGYEHLCIPMEFEPERKCYTSIGWEDPRVEDGELFFPERFPAHVVERDKKVLGMYATAGQFQQRPTPRGGGMFQRDWFAPVRAAPNCVRYVRGWDIAASTERDSAYTVGVLIGKTKEGDFVVIDVLRKQISASNVLKSIRSVAAQDFQRYGGRVLGSVPEDPGAGGKAWAQQLVKAAAGYNYRKSPESGDKETRAEPFSAQAEAGNVMMVLADWNKDYLDELALFPMGKFADQVDASSRSFMELNKPQATGLTGTQK